MKMLIVWARTGVVAVGLCIMLTGCGPKMIKTHPDIANKSKAIKTVALAEPEIKVYEISAGGTPELMDEWSAKGKENVTAALKNAFSGTPMKIVALKPDDAAEAELKEVMALFDTVIYSIITHTTGADSNPNLFTGKLEKFDYSVGSLETILNRSGGDALLLVYGVDQIATSGKKALNVLGTITGVAVAALTGINTAPRMEGTRIRMALADRNGTILWYNINGGVYDLRDSESSSTIIKETMEDFPGFGK